jgi:hypothetical protein
MLRPGGVWAVPRSGLVFQKTSLDPPTLTLVETMPPDPEMPMTAKQLKEFQEEDFNVIKEHFGEAGIAVVKKRYDDGD